jgi:hypothetical protein
MIHWESGIVLTCLRQRKGYQEVQVRLSTGAGAKAIHYTDALPPLQPGDRVTLNTTAVDLGLGTGGYHFVYSVDNEPWTEAGIQNAGHAAAEGHMMKLRYTPYQRSVLAAEEQGSPYHDVFRERRSLEGMPVLIGELHSMLPIALCRMRGLERESGKADTCSAAKIAYVMSDGGALPLSFSRHAAILSDLEWLQGTVTYGHAYGGQIETMNKFSALIAARHILRADIAIAAMGPGIAGTGTWIGHTGIEVGELVNAVGLLGGIPIVIPRISFADQRERHHGLSHHLLTSLTSIALQRAVVPLPAHLPAEQEALLREQLDSSGCGRLHDIRWIPDITMEQVKRGLGLYPEAITTMGKGPAEDAAFFLAVSAAAQFAWRLSDRTAPS